MTNEDVLDKVRMVMDELSIKDEDTRQDIYLSALQNPSLCVDHNTILLELINPIVYKHFNELQEINRKFVSYKSLDKMNKDNKITEIIEEQNKKTKQIQKIYDAATKFGVIHSYIIRERFLKETDLDNMAISLNIPKDVVETIIDDVILDIRSVLDRS